MAGYELSESRIIYAYRSSAFTVPGPAVMMVVTCALTSGWRRSVYATLGILSGNAIYFVLSASGISGLICRPPDYSSRSSISAHCISLILAYLP
jgi:threonine/homoserine/homoserine lactone efflux protein